MSEEIKKELAWDEIKREHTLMSELGAIVSPIEDTGQQLKFYYEKRSINDIYMSSGFVFRDYIKEPKLTPEQKLEAENQQLKKQLEAMRNCFNCEGYVSYLTNPYTMFHCKTRDFNKNLCDADDPCQYWEQKEVKDGE